MVLCLIPGSNYFECDVWIAKKGVVMLILKLGCGGKTFRLMLILQLKDWMRMTPKSVKEPQPQPNPRLKVYTKAFLFKQDMPGIYKALYE